MKDFQSDLADLEEFLDRYCQRGPDEKVAGHKRPFRVWRRGDRVVFVPGRESEARHHVMVRESSGYCVLAYSLKDVAGLLGLLGHDTWQWQSWELTAEALWGGDYKDCSPWSREVVGSVWLQFCEEDWPIWTWGPWRMGGHNEGLTAFVWALLRKEVPIHAFFDFADEQGLSRDSLFKRARADLPAALVSCHELSLARYAEEAL